MHEFLDKYPFAFILPLFALLGCGLPFALGVLSGWRALARRFPLTSTFTGETWRMQSARMRWRTNYGGCVNVGADPSGLQLSMFFLYRIGHPPLFVPWNEISVAERRKFLFFRQVKLLLGREEQIPFVISGSLCDRLQAAAGASWPVEAVG